MILVHLHAPKNLHGSHQALTHLKSDNLVDYVPNLFLYMFKPKLPYFNNIKSLCKAEFGEEGVCAPSAGCEKQLTKPLSSAHPSSSSAKMLAAGRTWATSNHAGSQHYNPNKPQGNAMKEA